MTNGPGHRDGRARAALLIGNRNYSSWSLRGWLALAEADVDLDVERIALFEPGHARRLAERSPSRRVPVLRHAGRIVWDSLAICEYAAETFAGAPGWPERADARALARSAAAEMHSGFTAVREQMPMNCRRRVRGFVPTPEAAAEIGRICALWRTLRAAAGPDPGPWLLGDYGIVDVMFAPVALRFATYGVPPDEVAASFVETVLAHPPVREWIAAARAEPEIIDAAEIEDATG